LRSFGGAWIDKVDMKFQQSLLFWLCHLVSFAGLFMINGLAAEPAGEERPGQAAIIHKSDVLKGGTTNASSPMRLWPLLSTPDARMNYVEVAGRSGMHFHPDQDHRLYVLEGKVIVIAGRSTNTAIVGDLIIIPKGVRHAYDVANKGDRALLLTFDAPPYDPKKTVPVDETKPSK
jgi:quercetin dioxygenase-like cupin family protein